MCVVICWVDTPGVSCAVMSYIFDSVSHRILFTLLQCHFESKSSLSLLILAILHVLKQLETLINGSEDEMLTLPQSSDCSIFTCLARGKEEG